MPREKPPVPKECYRHPTYKAVRPPSSDCWTCKRIWQAKEKAPRDGMEA